MKANKIVIFIFEDYFLNMYFGEGAYTEYVKKIDFSCIFSVFDMY